MITGGIASNSTAWDNLDNENDRAKYFNYEGQVCFVKSAVHDGKKNGCRVWNFSIEEFDKNKLQRNIVTTFRYYDFNPR